MKNAEEHKKLLAQIAELEKNSVNYFDVEKEFFLIDSNNLSQVRPKLYGYSIQETGIYEDDNLTPEAVAGLDGRGCYIYVENRNGQITIKQDLNGCWGIYLFRHGDYFALSNSFFRLLDHIKFKYPLTVNRDYAYYLVTDLLCSIAYSETIVNEIQLIDRSAILHIDIAEKDLQTQLIDYKEYTVPLDSEDGIATLDHWVELWGNVFRGVAQHTKFITADLSGGFDTRISLALLLNSGIDLNKIRIFSIKDELHTHKEDYEIASNIAKHYGFKLNQTLPVQQFLNYTLTDFFNFDSYVNKTFTNIPKFWLLKKNIDKTYYVNGMSGETLRHRWQIPPEEFMKDFTWKVSFYTSILSQKLTVSIKNLLKSSLHAVRDKHKIEDTNFKNIQQLLYHETWSRYHFGKESLCNYLVGILKLSPALDPEVRTLRLNTSECPDYNFLIVLLFTRYAPDLLKFPLDLNRSIAPETIAYAQKINERFPRQVTTDKINRGGRVFHLQPRDLRAEKILALGQNNPNVPNNLPQSCLKAMFESSRTYGLFTAYFDEELYRYAATYYDTHVFGRERPLYAICGVTRVLEDVEISQRNHTPYQDMKRFLEQDFCRIKSNDNDKLIDKFKNYFTARIDIQLRPQSEGDFQILSTSDDKATVWKPGWFNKDGIGYQIQSYVGKLEIIAKATADGKVRFELRGLDIRDPKNKSKRIPYWIDYTRLIIDEKVIFDKLTPAWHDKPYIYRMDAKAGKEIKIKVEWLPHRSDT